MVFEKCPRCGNYEEGYKIFICKKCQKHHCWRDEGFFGGDSGCGAGNKCPNCGGSKDVGLFYDSFKEVGRITPRNKM